MVSKIQGNQFDLSRLETDLRSISDAATGKAASQPTDGKGFSELLTEGLKDVNQTIKASEQASMDLASGKSSNLHETMLAATRAELGFNLVVQLRNKALEAYQEVLRMQV